MNFSRAVKGSLTRSGVIKEVDSQAELELGHPLTGVEKAKLFHKFSPQNVLDNIEKYGFGSLKFLLLLSDKPELNCDFSPNVTPRDGNCLLHAIVDGILNNDAFKHNGLETRNETWTQLLKELKFFEETDDHLMYLRRRFVLGAAEWMAGKNGSKQNNKELFEYTDTEWEFIWTTMLEDGAWAVPSIKDNQGNFVKENDAPEILIKYIAHDLKCHIIVFDLLLNRVQFLSGNHVQDNNVAFDSPLLMYTNGGHFQSVFQADHDFFVNYAKDLEAENDLLVISPSLPTQPSTKPKANSHPSETGSGPESIVAESSGLKSNSASDSESTIEHIKSIKAKDRTIEQKKMLEKLRKEKQRQKETHVMKQKRNDQTKQQRKNETEERKWLRLDKKKEHARLTRMNESEEVKKARQENNMKQTRLKREKETEAMKTSRQEKDKKQKRLKRMKIDKETEEIKKARLDKKKEKSRLTREKETEEMKLSRQDKVKNQTRLQREKETEENKKARLDKKKEKARLTREKETEEIKKARLDKKKEKTRLTREKETEEIKKARQDKDKGQTKFQRETETEDMRKKRLTKIKLNMKKLRNNASESKRLEKFRESVRYGPIFTCTVCEQDMFINGVTVITDEFEDEIRSKYSELYSQVFFTDKIPVELNGINRSYICTTCKRHMKKGDLPPMAAVNGLQVFPISEDLQLTELESNLIAKTILFQKIYQLPKSRMAACKDQLINVPISSEDVMNTLENLPRTPKEAGLLEVMLKRKKEYKNYHQQAYIDPEKIYKALEFLKKNGHPDYTFYTDRYIYERKCFLTENMPKFVDDSSVESIVEKDEFIKLFNTNTQENDDDASDEEEEEYQKNDVVRKFQFDYEKSVCLVDKFPEAAVTEESTKEVNQISVAPGEGKYPENILYAKDWDIKAFPMKHPDGKNNLHQKRKRKLTDQYYFVQRLRNKDTRFSTDPAYTFAAAAYLEKKQLQRNVNVSYQRGKEVRSKEGVSTFHLEDGFSVFNNISNTPKYWKSAKYEMLAKLDNLGPFHFFFTLSCADLRWDENFSSILRKLKIKVEYSVNDKGKEQTLVKYGKDNMKTMEMSKYLAEHVDESLHEMIRKHIYIATRNYNNRVRSFIRDIVTDKNNPMCVKHWSTKVEFQGRGAGHNHGVLWVDVDRMESTFIDDKGKWTDLDSLLKLTPEKKDMKRDLRRILKMHFVEKVVIEGPDAESLNNIYRQIFQVEEDQVFMEENQSKFVKEFLNRFPLYGLSSAFKKFQTREDLLEHEEKAVIAFANKFTTCTLNKASIASRTDDESLKERAQEVVDIVMKCYIHSHTKSCRKYYTECRFSFPRYPIWRTLISKPSKVSGEEGKALRQKYEKVLKDVREKLNDKDVIKSILDEIPKERDETNKLYGENREKRIRKLLSIAGLKTEEDIKLYEEALSCSPAGYNLILERDIDEIFINSYNPEWVRAWNGNTDLQVCLDYFAVITYITEYYTKDDTGMMTKLLEMLKNSECETLQERMKLVMNTFITARQMGECEAYYKIMPDLHLKDSNVSTVFIPTSRDELRSKFMIKIDEKDSYNGREKKKIEGKEGWFVEKYDLIDKYLRREKHTEIEEISPAQFFKMFNTSHTMKLKNHQADDNSESDEDENKEEIEGYKKFHYLMTASGENSVLLPDYIRIEDLFPGEPPFMKKRTKPAVLRFHKPKQTIDPASYFFSEALLYTSFRSEEELTKKVNDAASDGYELLEKQIHAVKAQVMEFLESNQEARFLVEEETKKMQNMGEHLDPEGEQEIEDCEQEGLMMHPDYIHLDPAEIKTIDNSPRNAKIYRPIEVDDIDILRERTRQLDFYQRKVIERGVHFARDVVKALNPNNKLPKQLRVIVHGGAGCGKSTVINELKQWCHLILQQPGADPDCPYVIVAAPTGAAASNIRGQTMHSAFGLNFGNDHFSLSDKTRDKKRHLMKNLKMVIIDEFSMVKSDQLFQLDKRLREVTQKPDQLFGGVAILCFGDIMQLKPVKGRYTFEEPINPDYKIDFHLGTHWQSFEVITLEENHRQGRDKEYADMLNRFRVGQQTDEDMEKLQTRVRPMGHADLKEAIFISCKNIEVQKLNTARLNKINEEIQVFEAINIHPTIKNFKPPIGNKGNVKNTSFLQTLVLKKGARVQLTYNIDTLDCLTNGTRGEVVDFVRNGSGIIEKLMIKFDETHQGKHKRETQVNLTAKFPGCTGIERVMFQYSLGKKSSRVSSTAKVIQFPIRLCFAATAHGFQGQTVYSPNKSANDFRTVFQAAQSYVMLSRVQALDQLFILGWLPDNKFYASPKALEELERLDQISVNKNPPSWEKSYSWSFKISVLNIRSLRKHFDDLKQDLIMKFSDVICLTETWLKTDSVPEELKLFGYDLHLNSVGEGKGTATYYKSEKLSPQFDIKKPTVQMSKFSSPDISVISVYRSHGADMIEDLEKLLDGNKLTIVCGDFNVCFLNERGNSVTRMLEGHGFTQLVLEATHLRGGHIDHVYSNHDNSQFQIDVMLYSPYYLSNDHDAICITIRKSPIYIASQLSS